MKLRVFLLTAMICTLCVGQASALEYTMDAPEDHLFGRPTSDDTIYEWEDPNVDRSKNTALIPPGFGSPTSYLPGSGTALTPNLVPGALEGGGLVSQTGSITYPTVDSGGNWLSLIHIFAVVAGSILYRLVYALVLYTKVVPVDCLKLVTALVVALAIAAPSIRQWWAFQTRKRRALAGRKGEK